MANANPNITIRDFVTGQHGLTLPSSRLQSYSNVLERAFMSLFKNPDHFDAHLHTSRGECGNVEVVGRREWESGRLFVGTKVNIFIHFIPKSGGLGRGISTVRQPLQPHAPLPPPRARPDSTRSRFHVPALREESIPGSALASARGLETPGSALQHITRRPGLHTPLGQADIGAQSTPVKYRTRRDGYVCKITPSAPNDEEKIPRNAHFRSSASGRIVFAKPRPRLDTQQSEDLDDRATAPKYHVDWQGYVSRFKSGISKDSQEQREIIQPHSRPSEPSDDEGGLFCTPPPELPPSAGPGRRSRLSVLDPDHPAENFAPEESLVVPKPHAPPGFCSDAPSPPSSSQKRRVTITVSTSSDEENLLLPHPPRRPRKKGKMASSRPPPPFALCPPSGDGLRASRSRGGEDSAVRETLADVRSAEGRGREEENNKVHEDISQDQDAKEEESSKRGGSLDSVLGWHSDS